MISGSAALICSALNFVFGLGFICSTSRMRSSMGNFWIFVVISLILWASKVHFFISLASNSFGAKTSATVVVLRHISSSRMLKRFAGVTGVVLGALMFSIVRFLVRQFHA